MNYIREFFNEDAWVIYVIDEFDSITADEDAAAVTDFEKKEIYFREPELNLTTILHELWHVYMGYCYLNDTTQVTLSDYEEITAALFSDKCKKILQTAETLLEKLKDLDRNEELER